MPEAMSNLSLVRVMLLKEVRCTFRERSQVAGLVVSAVMLVIALGGLYRSAHRQAHQHGSAMHRSATTEVATSTGAAAAATEAVRQSVTPANPRLPAATIRWVSIGGGAVVGFFFSMGYLLAAVLASFVGEKEARTLEILLATPLRDGKLFLIKCISVLLPSFFVGSFFAVAVAMLMVAFVPAEVAVVPAIAIVYVLLLGMPVMILPQLWFVGLGAAISIRAETVKGASQVLGTAMMLLIFGGAYGIPLLMATFPSVRRPLIDFGQWWWNLPFGAQYGMLVLTLGIPALALISLGRACFRRDRMLT
jgi:ABC-type Na+ efflux pump permease subunit